MENELITVSYDEEQRPYVMGRDLHEALGIRTAYKDWFPPYARIRLHRRNGLLLNFERKYRRASEHGSSADH